MTTRIYCTRVWALNSDGVEVFPYTGIRGKKTGLFRVNFTSDTNKFEGSSEEQLITAITSGKFRDRGTVRMLPLDSDTSPGNNAFVPRFLDGKPIMRSR